MSALPAIPLSLQTISLHAMERFCERVIGVPLDPAAAGLARVGLYRMYLASRPATLMQLYRLHVRVDWNASYLISDTGYGLYLLVIKDGTLMTLWSLKKR